MSSLVDCGHGSTRVLPMAGRVCPACRGNVDAAPAPRSASEPPWETAHEFAAEHADRAAERLR